MKIIHKKPLIFPLWAVFNNKDAGKRLYTLSDNGVCFDSDSGLLPHFNHIEMTGFQASSIISYRVDRNKKLRLHILYRKGQKGSY